MTIKRLAAMARLFRRGEDAPVILADDHGAAAAIILIEDYERLRAYDGRELDKEHRFRDEIRARIKEIDHPTEPGKHYTTVEDLARDLGPIGIAWADEQHAKKYERGPQ